tara:strand:+ start:1121 stop:3373 length:2253 start_codon:yes stop_codon:yes gene_type:complete
MLTGAGCSLSAGIPLAKALVNEIHEKYHNECRQKLEEEQLYEYGACMSCLTLNERRDLLSPHLDGAKINWAHLAIACLIKAGYVTRVLTFNFDSVLARACGLVGLYPATYDFAASASDVTSHLASPAIIHLHGQGFAHRLLNADSETAENAINIRPLFRNTLSQHPFIVIGYSGVSDSVFPTIKDQYHGEERLYWAGHSETPSNSVLEFLNKGGNTAEYLGNSDADDFLINLARELECFPPKLFSDPHGHLLEELEPVSTFPLQENDGPDLLLRLRSMLTNLKVGVNHHQKPDLEALFMEGKWEDVIRIGDPKDEFEKDIVAQAYLMQGKDLSKNAKLEEDFSKFEQAFDKFQKAIEIKPGMHGAYIIWGTALSDLASLKKDASIFEQAFDKFKKAIDIKPNIHQVYYNWGHSLSDLAIIKEDFSLFQQACDKFKKAVDINPNYPRAYANWGDCLGELANLKKDTLLYEQAFEKYQKAIDINPNIHEVYNNWGNRLGELAELKKDSSLFDQSFEKYQKAIDIKPDKHKTYYNWGNFLCDLAIQKEDFSIFQQAFDKYQKAIDINPDSHETYNNWGYGLYRLAIKEKDASLYEQAFEKYQKAIDINPDKHDTYNDWGTALISLASLKKDVSLFEEAFDKYQKALNIKPDKHETFSNWGVALLSLWRITGQEGLLDQAKTYLNRAKKLNPDETYNLACLYAVAGNYKFCRDELHHCRKLKTLPSKKHLLTDEDLKNIRDLKWFKELIHEMPD